MPEQRTTNSFTSDETAEMKARGDKPAYRARNGAEDRCGKCHKYTPGEMSTITFNSKGELRTSPRVIEKVDDKKYGLCDKCFSKEIKRFKHPLKEKASQ